MIDMGGGWTVWWVDSMVDSMIDMGGGLDCHRFSSVTGFPVSPVFQIYGRL
jgi:hypothetical protein